MSRLLTSALSILTRMVVHTFVGISNYLLASLQMPGLDLCCSSTWHFDEVNEGRSDSLSADEFLCYTDSAILSNPLSQRAAGRRLEKCCGLLTFVVGTQRTRVRQTGLPLAALQSLTAKTTHSNLCNYLCE